MEVIKSLEVPIYGNRLHICVVQDFNESLDTINKKLNAEFTSRDSVLGFSDHVPGSTLIMINVGKHELIYKKNYEIEVIGTITHESVHACNTLFKEKGLKLKVNNDEAQAYFTEWVSKEIYKVYLEFKKLKQHGK